MANNYTDSRWKGFVIGALGSVAGLLAMHFYWQRVAPQLRERVDLGGTDLYPKNLDLDNISKVDRRPDPDESATAVLSSKVYELITGHEPESEAMQTRLSNLTHWGYGILQGGLYGAARATNGSGKGLLDWRGGATHGVGLWLMGDEITVPMLGLQEGPTAVSPVGHINRLGAHLAYGLATAATTQILRRIL